MPETNELGLVALKHFNSNPATVKVDGELYSFVPKLSISMAWIKPEHVGKLLSEMTKVCCGNTKHKFLYANQLDVCLWTTGQRCT